MNEAIRQLEYSTRDVSEAIDKTVMNVYNMSDSFASDSRLQTLTNGDYTNRPTDKRRVTLQIVNQIFASYDLLRKNEKMAAFYTSKGELFNFLDPNADDAQCKKKLEKMEINSKDRLARFSWYPVQDNFLRTDKTGDIRKDYAVIGSRRVFSMIQTIYEGVHVFALSEEMLYSQYQDVATQYGADVYILNGDGALLSSSDENAIERGKAPPQIVKDVLDREYDRFEMDGGRMVCVSTSQINDWTTVVSAPLDNVTAVVDNLYSWIFWVMVACAAIGCGILMFLYRRFMEPVARLNKSMQKVYDGDLDAYVEVDKDNEITQMIRYYNSMLESINHNIKQKLQLEQYKKQLELEVLMNQINPHFLYNTLETIVWKSSEAGHPDIGRIAASLGRMYRLSTSNGELFISMKQELEHMMTYLKLQRSRYEDMFTYELDVDYLEIQDYYSLKILLQPLVENSLSHGMDGLERVMKIRVGVRVLDECIQIKVVDSGCGMTKETLARVVKQIQTGVREKPDGNIRRKSTGIGLHNVYERLKIYCGTEDSFSIHSKFGWGTKIVLTIPKITREGAAMKNEKKKKDDNE